MRRATHSNFSQDECEDLEKEVGQLSQKDFTEANDPVHLINSAEGNLSTSAFIPFCKFAGDMALLGFSLPVCNIFHPRGGTLGLFTGFSIMSGFEIVYFVVRIALGILEKPKEARKELKG